VSKNNLSGILRDTDRLIDDQLGSHKHGTVGKALIEAPQRFSSKTLLENLIIQIEKNLKEARCPSSNIPLGKSVENWREKCPSPLHETHLLHFSDSLSGRIKKIQWFEG